MEEAAEAEEEVARVCVGVALLRRRCSPSAEQTLPSFVLVVDGCFFFSDFREDVTEAAKSPTPAIDRWDGAAEAAAGASTSLMDVGS